MAFGGYVGLVYFGFGGRGLLVDGVCALHKEFKMSKLASRKLILTVIGVALVAISTFMGVELPAENAEALFGLVAAYVVGQVVAAVLAAGLLRLALGGVADVGATHTVMGLSGGVLCEIVLTAVLMFVITGVATDSRATGHQAALAVPARGPEGLPKISLGPRCRSKRFLVDFRKSPTKISNP